MPLYEMTVISKITEAQQITNLIKGIVNFCYQGNGVLRNVKNVGDRIAARSYKSKDKTYHDFVRYLTFFIDLDSHSVVKLQETVKENSLVLQTHFRKYKHSEYYKELKDRDYFKKFETFEIDDKLKQQLINLSTANQIARDIVQKYGVKKEEDINLKFDIKNLEKQRSIGDKI